MVAGSFQPFKVTAYFYEETVLVFCGSPKIGFRCAIIHIGLVAVDKCRLALQKFSVLLIRLQTDIERDKRRRWNRNHIIKTKLTIPAIFQRHNVNGWPQFFVVFLWRFHRDKIAIASNCQDDADIRTAGVFVILDTAIHAAEVSNIFVTDPIDF